MGNSNTPRGGGKPSAFDKILKALSERASKAPSSEALTTLIDRLTNIRSKAQRREQAERERQAAEERREEEIRTLLEKSSLECAMEARRTEAEARALEERRVAEETEKRRREEEARKAAEEAEKRRREEEARKAAEAEIEALHVEAVTCMDLPMDWENAFDTDPRTEGVHAESIPDALILSLTNLARVDIEYISSITGEDYKTVITALRGSIYQNPETWEECFYRGWETAEEYLSGNLMRKWKKADEANRLYHGHFEDNLRAIERVMPAPVGSRNIYVTLGSPWVPADIIDDFITYMLRMRGSPYSGALYDELTGTWEIPNKAHYSRRCSVASTSTYGTPRLAALHILERTLNMKSVSVTDEVAAPGTPTGKKRVLNREETLLAIEKQQKMIESFRRWVWKDEKRKERLETIFDSRYGCVRRRIFDGSFLTLPTLSRDVHLYPYQKNAVARILFSPNTLLAHDVGSGKTYIMIAAGMELRRMGLSEKNLYVVPNNLVGQWQSIFMTMYPSAKLMCVGPKDFTADRREQTLAAIRDRDLDGVIMAYSCFERIPLSKAFYKQKLSEAKQALRDAEKRKGRITAAMKRREEALKKELEELASSLDELSQWIHFDELGITRLFVDEAHNYKNVPIETKADKVLGISAGGSKKCRDMMDKVHMIQKLNGGGGVVMATGTPITNSITDAFVMQKYLQSGELALLDLQSFDSWIGMFAEKVTDFEIDVDTNSYRLATRFARFHNLPELTALLSSIADFHPASGSADIPAFDGYSDVLIPKTDPFAAYLEDISERAELVRGGTVSRKDDNMLKITTDGRKAALDLRLADPTALFTDRSKVAQCARRVFDIYQKTHAQKSTQLVFCDSSTPKSGFNIYDELKRLLCAMGMPADTVAYIHDADTEAQRTRLFAKVRRGEIRVLIGSTFKLGLGVNVQDRLIALHHLDIPWRPADMVQREGRILRQGNQNQEVEIYRYITEGSFDAYSWQLLETKQRFISELLSGSLSERSGADVEDTVLSYAEVKALAVGNPLVKKRVETANELSRLLSLHRQGVETRLRLEKELSELPARIAHQLEVIEKAAEDVANTAKECPERDKEKRKFVRERLFAALKSNVLMPSESVLLTYRGFEIVLPTNMTEDKPFVWLRAKGRYYVEMGDTETGNLSRIDNYLDKLPEHLQKLRDALSDLYAKQTALREELARKEDYTERIEETQRKLEILDKKLGVNKQ